MHAPFLLVATMLAAAGGNAAPAAPVVSSADATAEAEVRAARETLFAAARTGDRAALERLLADGFVFTHGTGLRETREQYLDNAAGGNLLFQRAQLETESEHIAIYGGDTAVWTSQSVAHNRGAGTATRLRSLNVFVRLDGRWQWAAGQSTLLPNRPAAAPVAANVLREYVGTYDVGPGKTLVVTLDGDVLRATVTGFRPAELIPRSDSVFHWFNPELNVRNELAFERDGEGVATHATFSRDGVTAWRAAKRLP